MALVWLCQEHLWGGWLPTGPTAALEQQPEVQKCRLGCLTSSALLSPLLRVKMQKWGQQRNGKMVTLLLLSWVAAS